MQSKKSSLDSSSIKPRSSSSSPSNSNRSARSNSSASETESKLPSRKIPNGTQTRSTPNHPAKPAVLPSRKSTAPPPRNGSVLPSRKSPVAPTRSTAPHSAAPRKPAVSRTIPNASQKSAIAPTTSASKSTSKPNALTPPSVSSSRTAIKKRVSPSSSSSSTTSSSSSSQPSSASPPENPSKRLRSTTRSDIKPPATSSSSSSSLSSIRSSAMHRRNSTSPAQPSNAQSSKTTQRSNHRTVSDVPSSSSTRSSSKPSASSSTTTPPHSMPKKRVQQKKKVLFSASSDDDDEKKDNEQEETDEEADSDDGDDSSSSFSSSSLEPPPYTKIRQNIYTERTKLLLCPSSAVNSLDHCCCPPEEPCGEDSACLNRAVYVECPPHGWAGGQCQNQRFSLRQRRRTEPFPTPDKGWGLRALERIPRGAFIMEYVGEVITLQESLRRMTAEGDARHHYFMSLDKGCCIDAARKGSTSRFINHSCAPNAVTQKWRVRGAARVGIFSLREIARGEEITFDYQFENFGVKRQKCHCAQQGCRGVIGGKRPESLDHTRVYALSKRIAKLALVTPVVPTLPHVAAHRRLFLARRGRRHDEPTRPPQQPQRGKRRRARRRVVAPVFLRKNLRCGMEALQRQYAEIQRQLERASAASTASASTSASLSAPGASRSKKSQKSQDFVLPLLSPIPAPQRPHPSIVDTVEKIWQRQQSQVTLSVGLLGEDYFTQALAAQPPLDCNPQPHPRRPRKTTTVRRK